MLTNKKWFDRQIHCLLAAAMIAWLTGCAPAGPRALLRGKRLIEQGDYARAVEELKIAAATLATNAQAWNYLGLAYHHAGQPANAVEAYQRALRLNPDLIVAHYNLGCLLLELNRPDTLDGARNEFTALTLHQGNWLDGWLKLGTADFRLGDLSGAEASFKEALRLDSQNAEALNDLGMIQMQRRRWRDAATYFNSALKQQPNYPPALLNFATAEYNLGGRAFALKKYREYLAVKPRLANWEGIYNFALQLDQELNPIREGTNLAANLNNLATNNSRIGSPSNAPKPDLSAATKPSTVPMTSGRQETAPLNNYASAKNGYAVATQPTPTDSADSNGRSADLNAPSRNDKKGFFQRLNPMSIFHPKTKPETLPPAPPLIIAPDTTTVSTSPPNDSNVAPPAPLPAPKPVVLARYPYLASGTPAAGDRQMADGFLAKAADAQRNNRPRDAVSLYRAAVQADPAYFDAELSLGAAAMNLGDLALSLRAYELALAVKPDSFSTRFVFALGLKRAGYLQDSAEEFEKLLNQYSAGQAPERLAAVHLALANLYADQFHQTARARAHYLKVLELDPHNSQETAIRYWLQDNS